MRRAAGFEPLGTILARMVELGFFPENLAFTPDMCENEAAPGGVDAPAEGLTEQRLKGPSE